MSYQCKDTPPEWREYPMRYVRYRRASSNNPRRAFFESDLSQFRKTVARADAAPVGPRPCHLHGRTQRTAASATI